MMKSKSTHLKSLGRLWVILEICGINEPIIFGDPIVFNPILAIPFIVTPIVTVCLGYLAQVMGLITPGYFVNTSFTLLFDQVCFSSMYWRIVLFTFGLVLLSLVIYYPFFKVYEKNMLDQECIVSDSVA